MSPSSSELHAPPSNGAVLSSAPQVVGDVKAKKEADEAWFGSLLARRVALAAGGVCTDVLQTW